MASGYFVDWDGNTRSTDDPGGGFRCEVDPVAKYVAENPEKLKADVALVSDTAMYAEGIPTLCIGLRGLIYMEVEATGSARDLHSGLYGGAAPNAVYGLVQLLAKAKDENGVILIPGIYNDVEEPAAAELDRHPFQGDQRLLGTEGGGLRFRLVLRRCGAHASHCTLSLRSTRYSVPRRPSGHHRRARRRVGPGGRGVRRRQPRRPALRAEHDRAGGLRGGGAVRAARLELPRRGGAAGGGRRGGAGG